MTVAEHAVSSAPSSSASRAWLRALARTTPIAETPERTLSTIVHAHASHQQDAPALLSEQENFTYGQLSERMNRYARWAMERGIGKGEVVGLLMPNRPDYLAIWLGITSVGGVVALLNTNLSGDSLAHCISAVAPRHIIVCATLAPLLVAALKGQHAHSISVHGGDLAPFERVDWEAEQYSGSQLEPAKKPSVTVGDLALYIFTSGTTGPPKAAKVSHARILQWSLWFAGMMDARPEDRMYNCLPMYHSVGGVQAPGAMLAAGGSLALRQRFSATRFWRDIAQWECTLFQYIGELCRYLLNAPPSPCDTRHAVRMACGNGLAPEVWSPLQQRFAIPRILEFYASTEGGVSLFNAEGRPGSIGRVPSYLTHRFSPALIRVDIETGAPVRDAQGFCMRCATHEVGEAIGRLSEEPAHLGSRFEGYLDAEASHRKLLRDVFTRGDAWVRTGDLMRQDEKGFFYFVDRVGDTFRWKGENVATCEVADAIGQFPGVHSVVVYGVPVPGADGRVGMAAISADEPFDLQAFHQYLTTRLPRYARPAFLRMQHAADVTGTFKYKRHALVRQGYDPATSADPLYFNSNEAEMFLALDEELFARIQRGHVRL